MSREPYSGLFEPFYFGPNERLFGVYHPPSSRDRRAAGIVLCYPLGQEYMRAHRAFVQLAGRLAECGFPTLRFDFLGCGDSHDTPPAGIMLSQCREDISVAVEELIEGTGVEAVCLCGLRLGASLAATAAAQRDEVDGLVLWDPIVSGADHVAELLQQHKDWIRGSFSWSQTVGASSDALEETTGDREALGFELSESLVEGLQRFDLAQTVSLPASRVAIIETQGTDELDATLDRLRELGAHVGVKHVSAPPVWRKQEDELGNVAVPVSVLEAIVDQLSEWYP